MASGFFLVMIANNYSLYAKAPDDFKKINTPYVITAAAYLVGSLLFCYLIAGVNLFAVLGKTLSYYLKMGSSVSRNIWPDTFYTVSELQKVEISQIAYHMHGFVVFLIAMASVMWVHGPILRKWLLESFIPSAWKRAAAWLPWETILRVSAMWVHVPMLCKWLAEGITPWG